MADRLDALESYINVSDLDSTALDSFTRSDLQNMETFFVQLSGGVLPYIDDAGITGGLSNAATPDSTGFDVGLSTLGSDMLPSDSVIYPTLGYASDAVYTPESLHERDDEETPIVPSTHLNDVTVNPNDLNVNKAYLAGGLMSPPEETHEYAPQGLDEPNFNSLYPTMTNIDLFDSTATAVSGSETIRIMKMPNPTVATDAHVQHYITNMILEQKPNPGSQTKAKEGVTPTPKSRGVTNVKVVNVAKVDGKGDTKNNDIDALSSKIAKLDLEDEKKGSHERQLDADIRKKHAALIYALYQKIHKLYIEMEEKEKLAMNKETRAREVFVE
ncbi:4786_t:CDS:1 [Paraglomus occultum]|uniref:4786_t:CDS:1 n=1 Tax=Paraglomus occultum TaxID=144539 RepID=A0A9N9G768_9GLOM|nr:4786_t:CDS:1 [Paraglomus occultum]